MARLLTPNAPDPITGLTTPVVGWHASAATLAEVFEGCNVVHAGGWVWEIGPDPQSTSSPPQWQLVFRNQQVIPAVAMGAAAAGSTVLVVVVKNTDWFTFDGIHMRVLTDAEVTADWTVAPYTLPAPPAAPAPA